MHKRVQKNANQVMIDIPEEGFAIMEAKDEDGYVSMMVFNTSIWKSRDNAVLKSVFGFHCSVILDYKEIDENLWPSHEEFRQMHDITEEMDKAIKFNEQHPNALFVGRIHYKGTCEMIWVVNNPDITAEYLDGIIARNEQLREFEYRIESDREWKQLDCYISGYETAERKSLQELCQEQP